MYDVSLPWRNASKFFFSNLKGHPVRCLFKSCRCPFLEGVISFEVLAGRQFGGVKLLRLPTRISLQVEENIPLKMAKGTKHSRWARTRTSTKQFRHAYLDVIGEDGARVHDHIP